MLPCQPETPVGLSMGYARGSYDGWVAESRINPRRESCTTMSRPPRAFSFESGRIAATSIGAEEALYRRGLGVLLVRRKIRMFSA